MPIHLNIYWNAMVLYLVLKMYMYGMETVLYNGSHEDGEFCFKK